MARSWSSLCPQCRGTGTVAFSFSFGNKTDVIGLASAAIRLCSATNDDLVTLRSKRQLSVREIRTYCCWYTSRLLNYIDNATQVIVIRPAGPKTPSILHSSAHAGSVARGGESSLSSSQPFSVLIAEGFHLTTSEGRLGNGHLPEWPSRAVAL